MSSIRLLTFALAALASMMLFVKQNGRMQGRHWSEVLERLSIVYIIAVLAAGSLEAFYQHAPFGWRVPAMTVGCVGLLVALWAGRNRTP